MSAPGEASDPLARLARETGSLLAELGVRDEDDRWIRSHAETIASLVARGRPRPLRRLAARVYRLARRAARTAR